MKILMVNKFLYPRGGCETYMLNLAEELKAKGHEVEYFGMYDEKNTVGNSLGEYTSNMDFHSTGAARFLYPFKIIYSTEAQRKIGRVLDEFKPDVVHMNNINFQLTPSIIYAVKKRGIPLVQTVHDYQMICPNHLLYSFGEVKPCERCIKGSKLNCFKYGCIHGSKAKSLIGALEAKLYSLLKTYSKVDLYICPSRFLEEKLLSASELYAGKTLTIHNFIEKKPLPEKVTPEKPYVAFASRLSKEKGVTLLYEAAKLLPDYSFVVAGSGPDGDCLKEVPNIKMEGFLTGDKLTSLMANAHVMLLPSVWYENCPLSILETHSFGVPVITMNSGGMAELVEDGKTGALINIPTPEAVAEAIKRCFEDKEYYDTLKKNCETMREKIIGVSEYCDVVVEQYQKLLSPR
ncbi:MAG: glycosyltransferase [Clostridia bacterium]|nr:glycosyltransferase [Clostridia bacterium]